MEYYNRLCIDMGVVSSEYSFRVRSLLWELDRIAKSDSIKEDIRITREMVDIIDSRTGIILLWGKGYRVNTFTYNEIKRHSGWVCMAERGISSSVRDIIKRIRVKNNDMITTRTRYMVDLGSKLNKLVRSEISSARLRDLRIDSYGRTLLIDGQLA